MKGTPDFASLHPGYDRSDELSFRAAREVFVIVFQTSAANRKKISPSRSNGTRLQRAQHAAPLPARLDSLCRDPESHCVV
jgi:hypothetical protein